MGRTGIRLPAGIAEKDPEILAAAAGLRYLTDDEPGITRKRSGGGFSFYDSAGNLLAGDERDRILDLAIPPAWDEVWISPIPDAHMMATGRDADGRKQYRYHDDYRAQAENLKFERLAYFGKALRKIRPVVENELERAAPGEHVFALAAATRLIDQGYLRVGNDVYRRSSGAQGATTLLTDALTELDTRAGHLHLEFVGKGGVDRSVEVDDPVLTSALDDLLDLGDDPLFVYCVGDETRSITSTELNAHIAEIIGPAFSAKDFRTWGGTITAAGALLDGAAELEAYDAAAHALGNTRSTARQSYVAPAVVVAAASGELEGAYRRSRDGAHLSRLESATEKVLRSARS